MPSNSGLSGFPSSQPAVTMLTAMSCDTHVYQWGAGLVLRLRTSARHSSAARVLSTIPERE